MSMKACGAADIACQILKFFSHRFIPDYFCSRRNISIAQLTRWFILFGSLELKRSSVAEKVEIFSEGCKKDINS